MQQNSKQKDEKTDEEKKIEAELKKLSPDERLQREEINPIEQDCLKRVFERLSVLEKLPSSDEDSKTKKYKKLIEEKANEKKMKLEFKASGSTFLSDSKKTKSPKKYKEDEHDQFKAKNNNSDEDQLKTNLDKKVGIKSVRKILKILGVDNISKEEMQLMIWEVDENLDNYVDMNEFERMYKRCIIDEKELEPKKLFYLTQFLMYDKDQKNYITEEDTLEILYIRQLKKKQPEKFNQAIAEIFEEVIKDAKGKEKRQMKDRLTYLQYLERMHKLSLSRRREIVDKRKNYCNYIKHEKKK